MKQIIIATLAIFALATFVQPVSAQEDVYFNSGQKWRKIQDNRTRRMRIQQNYERFNNLSEQQQSQMNQRQTQVAPQPAQQAVDANMLLLNNITNNMVQLQQQNQQLKKELNVIKTNQKSPGDYMVHAGRYQRAMLWSGILGGTAAAGCIFWSTTKDCKEKGNDKTFRTIGYGIAGATAVTMLVCYLSQAHCTVKAGKKLNVSLGEGLELSYNF